MGFSSGTLLSLSYFSALFVAIPSVVCLWRSCSLLRRLIFSLIFCTLLYLRRPSILLPKITAINHRFPELCVPQPTLYCWYV